MSDYKQQIEELTALPEGWDSYNGKPVDPAVADRAIAFIEAMQEKLWIVPGSNGGVQIEVHANGIDLEVCFEPNADDDHLSVERRGNPPIDLLANLPDPTCHER